MTTKLDLHVHTKGSDGIGHPDEFVKAIQDAGLDGITITDHHRSITLEGYSVLEAIKEAGLIALLGCEYSTLEGHCLVYGVNVAELHLGFYPSMQFVIDTVHSSGGVAFPSHPYRGVKETLGDRIYTLNGLTHAETYNGQNEAGNGFSPTSRPEANAKAYKAAKELNLGMTGGSDAHQPARIGTCYTEFADNIKTSADLVEALRSRNHIAKVNKEMVAAQKQEAVKWRENLENWYTSSSPFKEWKGDWEDHPSTIIIKEDGTQELDDTFNSYQYDWDGTEKDSYSQLQWDNSEEDETYISEDYQTVQEFLRDTYGRSLVKKGKTKKPKRKLR